LIDASKKIGILESGAAEEESMATTQEIGKPALAKVRVKTLPTLPFPIIPTGSLDISTDTG